MSFARRLCAFTVAIVLLTEPAGPARGDDGLVVSLAIDPCVDADAKEVKRLFALELGTTGPDAPTTSDAMARAEIGCSGKLIELKVHDPFTGKSLSRRIKPGPKTGRERLLALAVMELLVASWIELEATPDPVATLADRVAAGEARRRARRVARLRSANRSPWTRNATAVFGLSRAGLYLGGAGLRLVRESTHGYGWSLDLFAQMGGKDVQLGRVSVVDVSGSVAAHAHRRLGKVRLRLAAGARLGVISIAGDSKGDPAIETDQVLGIVGGPLLRGDAQVALPLGLTAVFSLESGYHTLGIKGLVNGATGVSIDGTWFMATSGIGWTW